MKGGGSFSLGVSKGGARVYLRVRKFYQITPGEPPHWKSHAAGKQTYSLYRGIVMCEVQGGMVESVCITLHSRSTVDKPT